MSLENEDESSAMEASQAINESQKKSKFSYTRDFLLSLSELEICKRLPSGFDQSILSEFEDASHGIQDRPRTYGGLPLQGFRRNDYSSSPPTQGDSSSFSRGVHGRWDNRSPGRGDKDGDSQSDFDTDPGRRSYGNQSRRPWQTSEHDGLLGSGSFPRPSGLATGTSAPKGQTNEHYHLNRSSEAYHPPRPFKAVPHPRTSTHDSFNDETFGSSECTSQDQAEEERKRRASFELMRKEQQKVLQEKQKSNANKHTSDSFADLILEETKEERSSEANDELNSVVQSVPNDDSGKSSYPLQSSKSRPLVPPGFRSTILEKNSTAKPFISSTDKENPKSGMVNTRNATPDNKGTIKPVHKLDNITEHHPEDKNSIGLKMGSSLGPLVPTENLGTGDLHLHRISVFPKVHEAVDGVEVFDLMTNKVVGNKILGNSSQESTTSILGKLFGSAPAIKNGGSGFVELHESKPDDSMSPHNVRSSKFAQWFSEDEKKPEDNLSSSRQNDLLSLIVGGDKPEPQVSNIGSIEHIQSELSGKGLEFTKIPSDSESLYKHQQEPAPPVTKILTCEDLEQTILSEYSEKGSTLQPPISDWTISGQGNVDAKVDNHATHHLLSLLQKGTAIEDVKSSKTNVGPLKDLPETGSVMMFENPKGAKLDGSGSGQSLTLETLFGTAFMKELQSGQAPVSVQRSSVGSARTDVSEPRELTKPNQLPGSDDAESWLNFNGPRVDMDPFREMPKSAKQAVGGPEVQLPEEESLITVGDPAFDIKNKLAALNSGSHFLHGPYDALEPERQFNNLHTQASSPQMHNRRPMFQPLDPNPQMRFPEHLMHRDTPNHQFPPNMLRPFHHPDMRVTGFDVPATRPQMLPQMQNFPPSQLLRDFPRPSAVHPHPSNQAVNFMPEREPMQGFPFAHRRTNVGGPGMPLPVPDGSSGSNHPEALQRMMEMELRAQSKQIGPTYGHELDMGFRYR